MKRKFTQEDLNKALDKIKQGPIGSKSQSYWNLVNNLDFGRDFANNEKSIKSRSKNTNYINSRPKRGDRPKQQRPVKAYKVVSKGSGRNYKEISKTYIDTFDSIWSAAEALDVRRNSISDVLSKRQKNTKGYTFEDI